MAFYDQNQNTRFLRFFSPLFLAPGIVPSDFVEPAEVLEDIDVINRSEAVEVVGPRFRLPSGKLT